MKIPKRDPEKLSRRALLTGGGLFSVATWLSGCSKKPATSPGKVVDSFALRVVHGHLFDIAVPGLTAIDLGKDDAIYAAGVGGVFKFSSAGKKLANWAGATPARALAVTGRGGFWVAGLDRIRLFSPTGEVEQDWAVKGPESGRKAMLTDIALHEANIYLADAANRYVHRFAVNGDFINLIGDEATPHGLVIPSPYFSLRCAPDGSLLLGHTGRHKVCHYRPDGELLGEWGKQGLAPGSFAGCCNPVGLEIMADGRILTAEKGLGRVSIFSPSGRVQSLVGPKMISPETRNLQVRSDRRGRVLVADCGANKILVFSPEKVD